MLRSMLLEIIITGDNYKLTTFYTGMPAFNYFLALAEYLRPMSRQLNKHFPITSIFIDCYELECQRPSGLMNAFFTYTLSIKYLEYASGLYSFWVGKFVSDA